MVTSIDVMSSPKVRDIIFYGFSFSSSGFVLKLRILIDGKTDMDGFLKEHCRQEGRK